MFEPSNCRSEELEMYQNRFEPRPSGCGNGLKRKMAGPCNGNFKKMKREIIVRRRDRTVRFAEFSQLILTEPKSSTDIRNAWFTKREISKFKRDLHLAAKAMRQTRTAKVIKYIGHSAATRTPQVDIHVRGTEIIRGLEHLLSPEVFKLLHVRRKKTIAAVIEEQQAQKRAGSSIDTFSTAQVSEANSSFSKEWCLRITHFQNS
eukprot:899102_1